MKAGRELDAIIAQMVMGWAICGYAAYDDWLARSNRGDVDIVFIDRDGVVWRAVGDLCNVWSPSTDIAAAWQVVEKLGYNWNLYRDVGKCGDDCETQGDKLYRFIYAAPGMPMEGVTADTAPLAICLAALKAIEK